MENKNISTEDVASQVDRMLLDFTSSIRNIIQLYSKSIYERDAKIKKLEESIKKEA